MDEFLNKFFRLLGRIITCVLALIGMSKVMDWLPGGLSGIVSLVLICVIFATLFISKPQG